LLNEVQAVLRSIVLCAADVDVEIVLIEAVEDDLDIACDTPSAILHVLVQPFKHTLTHDLVDLAILFPTDKLLVLIC